jgi:hypothetical protein
MNFPAPVLAESNVRNCSGDNSTTIQRGETRESTEPHKDSLGGENFRAAGWNIESIHPVCPTFSLAEFVTMP